MFSRLSLSAATLSLVATTSFAGGDRPCEGNIVDVAIDNEFTILVEAVQTAGLVEALQGPGPFTVFAPTDEAFAALPEVVADTLFANPQLLAEVLLYHVVSGDVPSSVAVGLNGATSLNGQRLGFSLDGPKLFIEDSEVILPDVGACNGVVHVINRVLVPSLAQAPALARAVSKLDVVDALIFANFATGEFSALVDAVIEADLVQALKDLGAVTLFAPTDAAFAALPREILNALSADPSLLVDVLLYHAVADTLFAADVLNNAGATTLLGADVAFSSMNGGVFINDAQVVLANRRVSNGVVHVINSVLLPPS